MNLAFRCVRAVAHVLLLLVFVLVGILASPWVTGQEPTPARAVCVNPAPGVCDR